ncbi:MAG: hypothetical protein ABUL64_03670 [Singulisphaera sp.]
MSTATDLDSCEKPRQTVRPLAVLACLGIATIASLITLLDYTPQFFAWRGVGDYVAHRAPEYARANALLIQVNDPWHTAYDPLHHVLAWRMLFPLVWHYGHLPLRSILVMPHLGCIATLWLVAGLSLARLQRWWPTVLMTLLFATLPWFFVSTGWLGYFDSWYVFGLVVAALVPSRWSLAAACLLTPWVDERFLLALPTTLLIRAAAFGFEERRAWPVMSRECAVAILCSVPYLAIRAFAWISGDQDSSTYVQAHVINFPNVPVTRFLAALWSGYRAGWLMIGAGLWLFARRAGGQWGAALAIVVAATAVGGLAIATDMSRTVMMICPMLILGVWLWEAARSNSQAWLLPAVVAANFLLPATHELWFAQFKINHFPTELARYRAPTPPGFIASGLIAEAELLLADGQVVAARQKLDEAIQIDEKYAVAYAHRAAIRINEKDFDGAMADADRAVTLDPTMPYAYFLRGYLRAVRGEGQAASDDLRTALGYGGPNWSKRQEAARLLEQLNSPRPADSTPIR